MLRLNHYLELLGEAEAGACILEQCNLDEIERTVGDFHDFASRLDDEAGLRGGDRLQLLVKAVQFAERGRRLLTPCLTEGARVAFGATHPAPAL